MTPQLLPAWMFYRSFKAARSIFKIFDASCYQSPNLCRGNPQLPQADEGGIEDQSRRFYSEGEVDNAN
jgi:hypothetical protein